MTNQTSIETSVAVIQEQLKQIAADHVEARAARKTQYEATERQNLTLMKIEHRLEKVENWMINSDPTIKEVVNLKLQAQGAGKLGRVLWAMAVGSIGFVAGVVAYWQKWIGN